MGEIVNLRKHRKRLHRAAAEKQAAENRVRFGRPRADRVREATEQDRRSRTHDGKRLDDPKPDETG